MTLKCIFIPVCFVTLGGVDVISDVTDELIKMTQVCVYVLLLKNLFGTYINVSGLNMSANVKNNVPICNSYHSI